jgi:hypothetical protein
MARRHPAGLLLAALAVLALLLPGSARPAGAQTARTVTVTITGQGTVTSTPAGIICASGGGTCSAALPTTGVTLVAAPAAGWTFLGWTGACTGAAGCTLPASTVGQSVGAIFGPTLTIVGGGTGSGSVTSIPAGIACVIISGVATGTCTAPFPSGTSVSLVQSASLGSTAAGCTPNCAAVLTTASTVTVFFSGSGTGGTGFVVVGGAGTGSGTVSSVPGGVACAITAGVAGSAGCSANFPPGTSVTLTASPATGAAFTGWSGACSTFSTTCTFTVGGAGFQSATANFNAQPTGVQVLRVTGQGSGSGTVTSTPTAIYCSIVNGVAVTDGPLTPGVPGGGCASGFTVGTVVNLVATPADDGSRFTGWSGVCTGTRVVCTVTIAEATTVTATFARTVTLTVGGVTSTGAGSVTSSPAGIACTLTAGVPGATGCSAEFAPGTVVTLSATPSGAAGFSGWSGACSGTGNCQVTVTQSTTVRAGFAAAPAVVVQASGTGSGRVTSTPAGINCGVENGVVQPSSLGSICRSTFASGATVALTATPGVGQVFVGWSGVSCSSSGPGGGTGQTGGAATCTVTLRDSLVAGVTFATLPAVTASATDLLTGSGLSPAERAILDQLGNADGAYNLGDLLALLDRTGQRLSGDVMARLLALPADVARPFRADAPRPTATPRRP